MSQPVLQSIFHQSTSDKSKHGNSIKVKINGETVYLSEFITDRLYFCTITSSRKPKDCPEAHYFTIDDELVYLNYLSDFGPLPLGHIAKYFSKVKTKLKVIPATKMIIHYTSSDQRKRVNAAFLMGAFSMMYLGKSPRDAYQMLLVRSDVKWEPFKPFQDAARSNSSYQLRLLECLEGLHRAHQCGFIRFNDFNVNEYEYYACIKHGDINWMVPRKIIAFSGPVSGGNVPYRPPEYYIKYFKDNDVSTVVRLNKKAYDYQVFTRAGMDHHELYFLDGSTPPPPILDQFLHLCETTKGTIAIHCKAGLGRTGSLIGAYLMKHYRMGAKEAIAWMRIARPGCVIGKQQTWLEDHEEILWNEGTAYRTEHYGNPDHVLPHPYGINSALERRARQGQSEAETAPNVTPASDILASMKQILPALGNRGNSESMSCSSVLPSIAPDDTRASSSFSEKPVRRPTLPGSVRTLSYMQKGRKHAYVPGKTISEMAKTNEEKRKLEKEKERAETQGDKLRRQRAMRERWYGPADDSPEENVE